MTSRGEREEHVEEEHVEFLNFSTREKDCLSYKPVTISMQLYQ